MEDAVAALPPILLQIHSRPGSVQSFSQGTVDGLRIRPGDDLSSLHSAESPSVCWLVVVGDWITT